MLGLNINQGIDQGLRVWNEDRLSLDLCVSIDIRNTIWENSVPAINILKWLSYNQQSVHWIGKFFSGTNMAIAIKKIPEIGHWSDHSTNQDGHRSLDEDKHCCRQWTCSMVDIFRAILCWWYMIWNPWNIPDGYSEAIMRQAKLNPIPHLEGYRNNAGTVHLDTLTVGKELLQLQKSYRHYPQWYPYPG